MNLQSSCDFEATLDVEHSHHAKFQQFSIESSPVQFKTKLVCKSAWGSGLLCLATGDKRHVPWIARMGQWFADEQEADGGWSNTKAIEADPPLRHRLEITAEFVVHFDTVIPALTAARSAGASG